MKKLLIMLFLILFIMFAYDCLKFYIIKKIKCPYLNSLPSGCLMVDIDNDNYKIRIDTLEGYLTYKNLWYCKGE
jgi:hypothetical protein